MINNKKVIGLTLTILALFGGVFVYARGGMMNSSNMYNQNHMNGDYSNSNHMNDNNHMNRTNTNNMMNNAVNNNVKSTEKVQNSAVPYAYNEEYFNSDAYKKEVEAYQKEMEQYRKEANEFRNRMLEEDYKNGRITKSERDLWVDYYKTMDKYQNSGMGYGMGQGMGCHGGRGMRGGHHGMMGNGMMGPGMMRGYSY